MDRLRNSLYGAASGAAFGFAFLGGEELLFAILKRPALDFGLMLALLLYYSGISALIGAALGVAGVRSLAAALWLWSGFTGVLLWGAFGPVAVGMGLPRALGCLAASLLSVLATIALLFLTRDQERKRWGACAGAWLSAVLVAVINGHLGDPLRPVTLGLDMAALLFAVASSGLFSALLDNRRPKPGGIALVVGVACWAVWMPLNQFRGVEMPDPQPTLDTPSILVIDVSGLRSDQLGFFTGDHSQTPRLDALAERSIVYHHAQSASSWPGAGFASLMTGVLPSVHGVRGSSAGESSLRSDVRTLAEYMQGLNYATRAIVTDKYLVPGEGFEQGFDTYHFVPSVGHMPALLRSLAPLGLPLMEIPPHATAEAAAYHARRFIRSQADGPWFMVLQVSDLFPHRGARGLSAAEYQASLGEIDRALAPVLDVLPPSAWVFVVSDQGLSLGEHAAATPPHPADTPYGLHLYQELLDTPLIAFRPRNLKPLVVETAVSTCDLLPTVLDLMRVDPLSSLHGRKLNEALGFDLPAATDRALVSQSTLYGPEMQALRRGDWKYIETESASELYNLAQDPGELTDLADTDEGRAKVDELQYLFPGRARPVTAPTVPEEVINRYEGEAPK